jgi:hypothetical protein
MLKADYLQKVKDFFERHTLQYIVLLPLILLLILPFHSGLAAALPSGPTIITNTTYDIAPRPAATITTVGGSFTTLLLNATTQTPRWKAYVGNVTGQLVLDDSNNKSIYDWFVSSVTGEVYATRNSTIDWSTVQCAADESIFSEDESLHMSQVNPDTINNTFINNVHRMFYVGSSLITNSSCRSISTYVNDAAQSVSENAAFQEILLQDDSSRLVYATIINQNTTGFNSQKYDFQMIVAEDEYLTAATPYYLYVELI